MAQRNCHLLIAILITVLVTSNPGIRAAPSDSRSIAFISDREGKPRIYAMNVDGSEIRLLIDPPGGIYCRSCAALTASARGRKLAFVSGTGDLYVADADGANVARVVSPLVTHLAPALSPDGRRLVVTSSHGMYYAQIFVIDLDGPRVTRLTNLTWDVLAPAFSPDGRKIAFISGTDYTARRLYVMNLDGSGLATLGQLHGILRFLTFNPKGGWIGVVSGYDPQNPQARTIQVVQADGSLGGTLIRPSLDVHTLAFSPDGRQIAMTCGQDVCAMNVDGSGLTALTSGWSPVFIR